MTLKPSILAALLWTLAPGPATALEPLDPADVEAFADAHFQPALEASGIPGATLAIVQDGEAVLLKGYGVADVETGAAVDPAGTLFRLGSITKPLAALAVLRLVERGALDLDAGVNVYLKEIEVPDAYGEPITLRHLLSHTGGFDADMSFTNLPTGADSRMAPEAVERRLQRMRRPGRVASYDVVGFGVLGLVLRDVTGMPFADVLREAVFEPLGMTRSVVGLPPDRVSEFARCHVSTRPGDARTCEQAVMSEAVEGSGAAAATAADMALLMTELLSGGRRLLSQAGFADFVDFDLYRFHPFGPGIGRAIQELDYAGRRAIGHGGGINGFNNTMDLFPAAGIGIYFGVTGGSEQIYDARLSSLPDLLGDPSLPAAAAAASARLWGFTRLFAERYIPREDGWPRREMTAVEHEKLAAVDDTANLAGLYVYSRFVSDNLMVNLARHSLKTTVERLGEEALRVDEEGPYERIAPLWYENPETGRGVAFRVTDAGTFLSFRGDPLAAYEKLPWYADPAISVIPLLPALILLASCAVYLLPRFGGPRRWIGALLIIGTALFLLALVLELEYATLLVEVLDAPFLPLFWRLGLHTGLLMFLMAPFLTARAWRGGAFGTGGRKCLGIGHLILACLSGIYLVGFGVYWDLIG